MFVRQPAIQEDRSRIVLIQALAHFFSVFAVLDLDTGPAKPSKFGRLGQPRQCGDQPATRNRRLISAIHVFDRQRQSVRHNDQVALRFMKSHSQSNMSSLAARAIFVSLFAKCCSPAASKNSFFFVFPGNLQSIQLSFVMRNERKIAQVRTKEASHIDESSSSPLAPDGNYVFRKSGPSPRLDQSQSSSFPFVTYLIYLLQNTLGWEGGPFCVVIE